MIHTKEGIMVGTSDSSITLAVLVFRIEGESLTFCLTDDNFEDEISFADYTEFKDDTLIGPSIMVNWDV